MSNQEIDHEFAEEPLPFDWMNDLYPHLLVIQRQESIRRKAGVHAEATMEYLGKRIEARAQALGLTPEEYPAFLKDPDYPQVISVISAHPNQALTVAAARQLIAQQRAAELPLQLSRDDEVNAAIDTANRRRQGANPRGYRHPLLGEVRAEKRSQSQYKGLQKISPRPRKPTWRENLTRRPAWQEAVRWDSMPPGQQAIELTHIADAVNTETGLVAAALSVQTEWNELEESGQLKQLDFAGFLWPQEET